MSLFVVAKFSFGEFWWFAFLIKSRRLAILARWHITSYIPRTWSVFRKLVMAFSVVEAPGELPADNGDDGDKHSKLMQVALPVYDLVDSNTHILYPTNYQSPKIVCNGYSIRAKTLIVQWKWMVMSREEMIDHVQHTALTFWPDVSKYALHRLIAWVIAQISCVVLISGLFGSVIRMVDVNEYWVGLRQCLFWIAIICSVIVPLVCGFKIYAYQSLYRFAHMRLAKQTRINLCAKPLELPVQYHVSIPGSLEVEDLMSLEDAVALMLYNNDSRSKIYNSQRESQRAYQFLALAVACILHRYAHSIDSWGLQKEMRDVASHMLIVFARSFKESD